MRRLVVRLRLRSLPSRLLLVSPLSCHDRCRQLLRTRPLLLVSRHLRRLTRSLYFVQRSPCLPQVLLR